MNTQFNSNVIWLQLEYKISTLVYSYTLGQHIMLQFFFLAMTRRHGLSDDEAGAKFFILDENGLITKARKNLLELEENFYSLTTFAEDDTSMEGMGLEEVHSV